MEPAKQRFCRWSAAWYRRQVVPLLWTVKRTCASIVTVSATVHSITFWCPTLRAESIYDFLAVFVIFFSKPYPHPTDLDCLYWNVSFYLLVYAQVRGLDGETCNKQIPEILEKLDLHNNANDYASTLSGGRMRRLCLGNALVGKTVYVPFTSY